MKESQPVVGEKVCGLFPNLVWFVLILGARCAWQPRRGLHKVHALCTFTSSWAPTPAPGAPTDRPLSVRLHRRHFQEHNGQLRD